MGALVCVIKSMAEGGQPREDMNRSLVSMMSKALERPDLGADACSQCAGGGATATGAEIPHCDACAEGGRMVAA